MAEKTGDLVFWNSNFMFLNYPESLFLTLANLLGLKGRWYLITLPILLGAIWVMFYTPWVLKERKEAKKAAINT